MAEETAESQLLLERLARRLLLRRRIDPVTGCWLWQGGTDRKGYGRMSWAGSTWRVHVLAAVCWKRRSPLGKRPVGHSCQSRACFNPAHLFVAISPSRLASLQKTRARGERSSRARISLEQARQIVAALALGSETHVEIAQRLSASVGIVWDIARGRTWKHLARESSNAQESERWRTGENE